MLAGGKTRPPRKVSRSSNRDFYFSNSLSLSLPVNVFPVTSFLIFASQGTSNCLHFSLALFTLGGKCFGQFNFGSLFFHVFFPSPPVWLSWLRERESSSKTSRAAGNEHKSENSPSTTAAIRRGQRMSSSNLHHIYITTTKSLQ